MDRRALDVRALWLADVLRDADLIVHEYEGWEERGRDDFSPVGIIWHHTVTRDNREAEDYMLAKRGSIIVPPPLCNYSTNRDGSITVIASGTANHGGAGEWKRVSGNRFFFGDEMKNLGTHAAEPWPLVQIRSARRASAAILRHMYGDDVAGAESMVCGHKEYATPKGRKTDPHTLNMELERQVVKGVIEEMAGHFKDVSPKHFAYKSIEWLADEGITSGINPPANDMYGPDLAVTRGQLAVFLKRYYDRFLAGK